MSDKSGGFFSSVGRFFSGGSASKNNDRRRGGDTTPTIYTSEVDEPTTTTTTNTTTSSRSPSTAAPAALLRDIISNDNEDLDSDEVVVDRNPGIRHLSPSLLDHYSRNPTSGLEIDVEQDVFFTTPSVSTNRKRQLTELDRQALPQSFRNDNAKRSRVLNRSLLEPTVKGSLLDKRLDMTWNGELTGNHSPASSLTNFSVLSRRSGATTNGSLSTRTQEVFKRLEKSSTPAKDVQRMSTMRPGYSRPERWSANDSHDVSSIATPPPPLRKAGDAIPSRIQLISKTTSLSARKTPYWKDLTRNRTTSKNGDNGSSETSSLRSLNGTLASTELSSVFALEPLSAPRKESSPTTSTASTATINSSNVRKPHVPALKGSDGKTISRNTFKLNEDIEEEDEDSQKLPALPESTLSNPQPLRLAPSTNLKRGFLDNLCFSFSAPLDVVAAVGAVKTTAASVVSSSESKEDSDSSESVEKQTSESSGSSDSDSGLSEIDECKESRPQTSADTVSSANPSSNQSSKDTSPKSAKDVEIAAPATAAPPAATAAAANWTCEVCWTSWPQTLSKCGACETPREGGAAAAPAQKQLVSNLNSFAPTKPGNFSFGFGGGPAAAPAAPAPATTTAPAPTTLPKPAAPSLFGTSTTAPSLFGTSTKPTVAPTPSVAPVAPAPVVTAPTAAPTSSSSSTEKRVDWDCPQCMVPNKATADKCVCCEHVMYKTAETSSNVFGSRAFKPAASTGPAVQFGVSSSQPTFGFGASKPAEPVKPAAPVAPVAPTAPAPTSTFGIPNLAAPSAPTSTFGIPKPAAPSAPAALPTFGLPSLKPAAPAAPTAPAAAPEPAKPIGSMFGNLTKPAEPTPAPVLPQSTIPSMFGSNNLFGAPKPAEPVKEAAPKTNLFGSLSQDKPATTAPATSAPAPAATTSLFGNPTAASPFGGSSLFGAQKPPAAELPKPASTLSFGSNPAPTTDAPKTNLFGSSAPAPAAPSLFGSGSSTSTTSIFSTKPADSGTSSSSIFGKPIQFPGEVGTTTTDGGPAKRAMFSSDAPKLTFGSGSQSTEPPKFGGFGGSTASSTAPTTSGGLFGSSNTAPMFGGSSNAFPSSSSTTTSAFGTNTSTTIPFGGASNNSGFGGFGKPTQPGMSTSSSTNSLFGQAAPADSSNPFASSTTSNGFNFGGASSSTGTTGGSVFQFGGSQPTAPSAAAPNPSAPFQFGSAPTAPGSMDNAFSYQAPSGGARKMAMARRRNIRK